MAKSTSTWISHVEAFVDSSRPSTQQSASVSAIASLLKSKILTLESLVKEMELYLTATDHVIRARGTLLLAEILTSLASESLESTAISSLIGFFTSKLVDWQVIHGALIGCLALLRRKSSVGMVTDNDAAVLLDTFLSNVHVQSLALKDRKLCFEVLLCLLDVYPEAAKTKGEILVCQICEAIDQEKDPRCLILTFHLVEILVQLFPDPSGPVASFAEELFDILGCYFPIDFTHPNEDINIKREDLAQALMQAFSSTPYFEPFVVPLLLDKLSSSLQLAKLDSLKYLNKCILHYGTDRMMKHSKTIWFSLKDVIFHHSPQEPLFCSNSELAGDTENQEKQIAKEALRCLQAASFHLDGPNCDDGFIGLILEDHNIETIFASVSCEISYTGISEERLHQLRALGSIISVASKVSTSCCSRVFQKFFPRMMNILGVPARSLSEGCITNKKTFSTRLKFGALYLCTELLASCRDSCVASPEFFQQLLSLEDEWFYMLQNFSYPLTNVLGSALITSDTTEVNENTDPGCYYYGVKVLQVLATFPGCLSCIPKDLYDDILAILMSLILDRSEDSFLWTTALKALIQIGSFIDNNQDAQKGISYTKFVVERIISLLRLDDSPISLTRKLEAVSKIGTTGVYYMSGVIRGLEDAILSNIPRAYVERDTKAAEVLVPLLECYSNQVLPWCINSGNFEVVMNFAFSIWKLIENTIVFNICSNNQVILDLTMMTMKLVVGGSTEENQRLIVEKAYNILSSTDFFLMKKSLPLSSSKSEEFRFVQDVGELSCRDEWVISLFSSVVVALRPQTPVPDPRTTMELLIVFLLKGHVPTAHALASMINKWPAKINKKDVSSVFTLEEAIEVIFDRVLSNVTCSSFEDCNFINNKENSSCICPTSVQVHAAVGLGWIGKSLLMRGHDKVKEITMLLLKLLSHQDDPRSGSGYSRVKIAAADAFHIFLSDSDFCLNKEFHAIIRPLYKQRFYSSMMPILVSLIMESDSSRLREVLYLVFGHVISATPLAAVVNDAKKVIPTLLGALSSLCLDILNKDLLYSVLLVLAGILMDENGKEAIMENTHSVISHLVRLVAYPHLTLVRETAIQCLVAMSGLPHTRIYPMRPQVLTAVSNALDDRKRAVRQEAVKCRQTWASIASRSLHV